MKASSRWPALLQAAIGLLALGGCESMISGGAGSPVTGYGSSNALPANLRLAGSSEETCARSLQFGADSPRVIVQPGETASFPVKAPEVTWFCFVEGVPRGKTTSCKQGTTFVRVTRPTSGNHFLIECFRS